MENALATLSEKEKETLRLIVRGHDAKSIANALELSVHTINDRLRAARRKLSVTSSREAARLLLAQEGADPQFCADTDLGSACAADAGAEEPVSADGRRAVHPAIPIIAGVCIMLTILTALVLASTQGADTTAGPHAAAEQAADAEHAAQVAKAAGEWLALVDARDWEASYAATAASFQNANTLKLWSDTASQVQGELGTTLSRQFLGADDVPSPQGFTIVKYRTSYINRADVIETLSLVREDGVWKVAGIYVS